MSFDRTRSDARQFLLRVRGIVRKMIAEARRSGDSERLIQLQRLETNVEKKLAA